jgi:selenocysteine-specific elongation factor
MGTAGHIDHGKTALIKTLTGIDCDTHKQEKQRGITINLGFAHINLTVDDSISIVDVPGHKDFIHTMVAGASGIDFVLMVIAADSGIMPQTQEHLQIMEMLEITNGIIALTKVDLVDDELIELAQEEITEFTQGTFLENAPVIPVSSVTGKGIPELKDAIQACTEKTVQRVARDLFRLFIDRIFTVSGFGTVVTGSVIDGILKIEDKAYLLPTGKKLRVRRLERHGSEVKSIVAGDRASINLVGLSRADFKRGMVITNQLLKGTKMIDAQLTLFPQAHKINIWSSAIFLLGTFEAQAKIHLIDKNSARGGDTVIVQVHLPEPCIICTGDRFIIRNTSNDLTLGGGNVLDSVPLHHRRRPQKLVDILTNIAQGNLPELIAIEVKKVNSVISSTEVAERLNTPVEEVNKTISDGLPEGILSFSNKDEIFLITTKEYDKFVKAALNSIKVFHQKNPMEVGGKYTKDIVSMLGLGRRAKGEEFVTIMLDNLVNEGKVKKVESTWVLISHEVVISEDFEQKAALVDIYFKNLGLHVAPPSEISAMAQKNDIDDMLLEQILRHLTRKKRIFPVDGDYLHIEIVDSVRLKLLKALSEKPEGMTVAEFRDLISDNRKICLRLFSLYDIEGITLRKGDLRVISQKGKELLARS